MDDSRFLKLAPPPKKEPSQPAPHSDPLLRFKGVILNLIQSASDCLNRISRQEMQKNSPSPTLMEEYFLMHHYLDFIERLCRGKKDSSLQTLSEEYLLLHESMHFE
jgi:hypothetical protein